MGGAWLQRDPQNHFFEFAITVRMHEIRTVNWMTHDSGATPSHGTVDLKVLPASLSQPPPELENEQQSRD